MVSRILVLALSCCLSFGLLVVIAMRSNVFLPGQFSRTSAQLEPVPPATVAESVPRIATVSLEPTPGYVPVARPIDVLERQFDRLVSRGLVLVKFGADWCGPCRRIVPELEQLASHNAGDLTVLTVDVDKEKRLAKRHGVGPIPQMILFYDGKAIDDWTGFSPASRMQLIIDNARAESAAKGEILANPFAT
jgi:thioredoxin 1